MSFGLPVLIATQMDNEILFQNPDRINQGRICHRDKPVERRPDLSKCIYRFLK